MAVTFILAVLTIMLNYGIIIDVLLLKGHSMNNKKALLKAAYKDLKIHYFLNVIVVFIAAVIINGGYIFATDWGTTVGERYVLNDDSKSNAEIIEEFVNGQDIVDIDLSTETAQEKYTKGYFSVFVNEITSSGSLGFGILNGINKILFKGKIAQSVTIFAMTVISAFIWIFIKNILIVGRARYFIERRTYKETKADRLLFIYRTGVTKNVAKIMLIRSVRQALWNLTIIGGFIKSYEYSMIPYILAENPYMSAKEAFGLSKQLTMNDKKDIFILDIILLPLKLLDGATFALSSLFFFNPYKECLYSEIYCELRRSKKPTLCNQSLLFDLYIEDNPKGLTIYPDELCPIKLMEKRRWLNTDWDREYKGDTVVLFFFFFSFIGWAWEVFFYLVNEGAFINRGTMLGPWLPIYGVGGWIIIYGLKPLRKKPALMFLGTIIVCGGVEYFTSWLLEKLFNQKWWDYTGYFMNLNGRICLEGLLVFGLAGVAMTYFIAPLAENLLLNIDPKIRKRICVLLIILFISDLGYSAINPNTGDGVTEGLI